MTQYVFLFLVCSKRFRSDFGRCDVQSEKSVASENTPEREFSAKSATTSWWLRN